VSIDSKLHALTLKEALAAIAAGRATAGALADAHLARIAATNPTVEAWEAVDPAHVRAAARRCDDARAKGITGPLAGIGAAVKDIIATADLPTTMGSAIYAGHRPAADAVCVSRLRSAGAYVFGKSVTTPFAYMDPGKTRNPWDAAHTPGGSSSGSAAAVAAGHVSAAIGTQTNGSIVRPAAYCGVVGFKPTSTAIPVDGVYLFSPTLDTVGTFTRAVADAALLASVLADAGRIAPAIAPLAKAPRLAYLRGFPWVQQEGDAQAIVDAAAARLARDAEVVPVEIPVSWQQANRIHRAIMLFEGAQMLGDLQQRERARLTPAINAALDEGRAIGEDRYREALEARSRAIAFFTDWLDRFDAVLAPAAPGPAPKGLATTGDPSCCTLWSLLGFPALGLPAGMAGRLPMGLQLAAPRDRDDHLLSVAAWCEARLPFRALD
jgi:Asp-tRNA(Asn)/Glu-tRNA(Gln) amidotransferase A subunit family amidase